MGVLYHMGIKGVSLAIYAMACSLFNVPGKTVTNITSGGKSLEMGCFWGKMEENP